MFILRFTPLKGPPLSPTANDYTTSSTQPQETWVVFFFFLNNKCIGKQKLSLSHFHFLLLRVTFPRYFIISSFLCPFTCHIFLHIRMHAQSVSHAYLCNLINCSLPGSFVHGISQARILEWVAIFFSRGSFQTRDQTHVSCVGRQILYQGILSQ